MAFGFNINNDYSKGAIQPSTPQVTTPRVANQTDNVAFDNKVIGEFGDKLLEQVQPRFVQAAQIPAEDAADLKEMFAMAGMKNPVMPTVKQYASVAGHVDKATESIDKLAITNNAERLFDSEGFKAFNKLFDID